MPIHLPPISRRQFLARSLATGAGLVLSQNLFAASRKVEENTWALFSDTHIAADPAHIARTANMTANLKAVAKEVIALPKRPAAVLISGDLAHFQENYVTNGVPWFNYDRAQTLASLDRFKQIASNLRAKVILQHDARDIGKLPAFPASAK